MEIKDLVACSKRNWKGIAFLGSDPLTIRLGKMPFIKTPTLEKKKTMKLTIIFLAYVRMVMLALSPSFLSCLFIVIRWLFCCVGLVAHLHFMYLL